MFRKLLVIIIFITFYLSATADTFIVTSNADSGPGSLREAIQKATDNGLIYDTVLFNLPNDFNSRTILLKSQIKIPSNIVIDATSQPGNAWGLSDAKICIRPYNGTCIEGAFFLNKTNNCEIYGLWFDGFNSITYSSSYVANCVSFAVAIVEINNVTFGSYKKGNVFSNNTSSIAPTLTNVLSMDTITNNRIQISSNFFGVDTSGNSSSSSTVKTETLYLGLCRNVLIGGTNSINGNLFAAEQVILGSYYVETQVKAYRNFITVQNNSFGLNYNKNKTYPNASLIIQGVNGSTYDAALGKFILHSQSLDDYYAIQITNNIFGIDTTANSVVGIQITAIGNDIDISNNIAYDIYYNNNILPSTQFIQSSFIDISNCVKNDSIVIRNNTMRHFTNAIKIARTKGVTITNNEIVCNRKGIGYYTNNNAADSIPVISIKHILSGSIDGLTSPLAKVEVFKTDSCTQYCENGKTLIGTTVADANGFFSLNCNTASGLISATATNQFGSTSEFNGVKIDTLAAWIKNATCGKNNGSITRIRILNASSWFWEDSIGNIISKTDTNLYNLPHGRYRLHLKEVNVNCDLITGYFSIDSVPKPTLTGLPFTIYNSTCGQPNGSIKFSGVHSSQNTNSWLDSLSNDLHNYTDSISNLLAQKIYFKLSLWQDTACYTVFGPLVIQNQSGPSLNTCNLQIIDASCNNANGSIKNIVAQNAIGNQFIKWEDSLGNIVATSFDLQNIKSGKYRLKFKDATGCDTIATNFFVVKNMGIITIDSSHQNIKANSCKAPDGFIKGITAVNADTYQWVNVSSGAIVGSSSDLINQSAGSYKLKLSNNTGCLNETGIIKIPQSVFDTIYINKASVSDANCAKANGNVTIAQFNKQISNYLFEWIDSVSNSVLATTPQVLNNIYGGTYFLIATDTNGCKQNIFTARLKQYSAPYFDYSAIKIIDDTCNLMEGSITGLIVKGGGGNYNWNWINNNNPNSIAVTANGINSIAAGNYYAIVKDNFNCTVTSNTLVVNNQVVQLAKPIATDVLVLRGTAGTFIVNNINTGEYYLYDTLNATQPVTSSTTGILSTQNIMYDKQFYIQLIHGNCSSSLQAVWAKVFDDTKLIIPNAFSPNGDGINDKWVFKIQGVVNNYSLSVFDRSGQIIFKTNDVNNFWDGNYKDKPVPIGTYYYLIQASDYYNKPFKQQGSVTIVR